MLCCLALARGHGVRVFIAFILLLMTEDLLAETGCEYSGICELQAKDDKQTLASDSFPSFVYIKDNTTWQITAHHGDRVVLTLGSMSTYSHSSCHHSFLQVFDDNYGEQFNLTKICHGETSRTFISSYSSMVIKYKGPTWLLVRFRLYYQLAPNPNGNACTGVPLLVKASAIANNITPPYYTSSNCDWRIVTEDKETILKLQEASGSLPECFFNAHDSPDDIRIYDGPTEYDHEMDRLCGNFVNHIRMSSSRTVYVKFRPGSHASENVDRFILTYQAVDKERLFHKDLVAIKEVKEVKYPSYPSLYPNNAHVSWTIRTDADKCINVSIVYHWIERSTGCGSDFLEIYDGSNRFAPRHRRLCDVRLNTEYFISTGPAVFIRFVSDGSIVNKGFKFKYFSLERKTFAGCSSGVVEVEVDENESEITSPGFPYHYPINVFCQWRIKSKTKRVRVTVGTLDLKQDSHCSEDYLKIFNGYSSNKPVLETFCANQNRPKPSYNSTSSVIFIQFKSGARSSINDGFKLFVAAVEDEHPDNSFNPSDSDSDDLKTTYGGVAAGTGVVIFLLIAIALRIRYSLRTTERRRTRTIICGRIATVRIGRVIRTDSQRPGLYVTSTSSPLEYNTLVDESVVPPLRQPTGIDVPSISSPPEYDTVFGANVEHSQRQRDGISVPSASSPPEYITITDGHVENPPSYAEAVSESQDLVRSPEYTPRDFCDVYDNSGFQEESRAEGYSTQPPNHSTV